MAKITIVFGPPCSGKSTYVNSKIGTCDIRFDYDLLIGSISALKSHEYSDIHLPYVMDFRKSIIKRSSSDENIASAYIIATKITPSLIKSLRGFDVEYYENTTSKEQCLEYLQNDESRPDKEYWIAKINDWFEWRSTYKGEGGDNRMEQRHAYFNSEFKTREEAGKKIIAGYFAVFNQETELWNGVYERIAPGAFDNTLKNDDIRCLFNHNNDIVLGRTANTTLTLRTDAHGLWGEVVINEADSEAVNAYERIKRGDITGCSFGFETVSEDYTDRGTSVLYTETEVKLYEVSPCTFPAYQQTEIQSRKANAEQAKKRQLEQNKNNLKSRLEGIKC